MIIKPNGTIRFLTVGEHLQNKSIVFQGREFVISLNSDKKDPFSLNKGHAEDIYIDLFALRFGHKEQLHRRIGKGWIPIHYGCSRSVRDEILLLPAEDIISAFATHNCFHENCQYWSHPTGIKSKYAINCILARYMVMDTIDLKSGLTLEEVSRVFRCTRERIRQIEEKAMRRMRHHTRSNRFRIFQECVPDYRDYFPAKLEEIA
jgi:hypothetical protein